MGAHLFLAQLDNWLTSGWLSELLKSPTHSNRGSPPWRSRVSSRKCLMVAANTLPISTLCTRMTTMLPLPSTGIRSKLAGAEFGICNSCSGNERTRLTHGLTYSSVEQVFDNAVCMVEKLLVSLMHLQQLLS